MLGYRNVIFCQLRYFSFFIFLCCLMLFLGMAGRSTVIMYKEWLPRQCLGLNVIGGVSSILLFLKLNLAAFL